jgi:hypothetical protein
LATGLETADALYEEALDRAPGEADRIVRATVPTRAR